MSALKYGVVVALAVAGPPLWTLVDTNQRDVGTALVRGAVVALACAVGVALIESITRTYKEQNARVEAARVMKLMLEDLREKEEAAQATSAAAPALPGGRPPADTRSAGKDAARGRP